METSAQLKRLGTKDHSCHRNPARLLPLAKLTAAAILLLTLVNRDAAADQLGACRLTANTVLRSCQRGAQSDYWLALGKCDNIADPAARQHCQKQASADLKDARQSCREQHPVRQAACERLGEAPYDPVIDPSNFVAQVDNPYFPLTPGTTSSTRVRPLRVLNTMSSP